jgi:murein DD-endopeptidase MepM/ murein hydrolase activator NlpD
VDNIDPGHLVQPAHQHSSGGAGLGKVPSSRLSDHPQAQLAPAERKPTTVSPPPESPDPGVGGAPSSGVSAGSNANPSTGILFGKLSGLFASVDQPPPFLIPIYKKAAHRYHVPWQVLAAINWIETDFGRNLNISSAGAIGWMQFMPATWAAYGVSASGKGKPNPYDPRDAIFAAARYLAANGAKHDLRGAIFAYNHATWYVDEVMWKAQAISDHAFNFHNTKGYALPLDARYMHTLGRTDDGVDIETAPDGAAVYSMTPGIVTTVASNPGGFGPNYPVILVTGGPLAGQYIYYGHVAASLVKAGQHVLAGQPIAVMGHTGDAAYLGHGHIEIGFSDVTGNPTNHHGAAAWTPSGDAMRRFLIQLSSAFHIKNS